MSQTNSAILLVDDEVEVCWALDRILQKIGCTSLRAYSGRDALAMAQKADFDLVLVDARLPDQDGIDVVRALRERWPRLRAILISGGFVEDDPRIQRWVQEGQILGFISKPFSIARVRSMVQQALARPAAAPASRRGAMAPRP